jgi:hypothetical protein
MNKNSLSEDALDSLFSGFFKAQMKQPWPAAPGAPAVHSEPSTLATSRAQQTTETPRNQPVAASHDSSSKARYTLAASVALLIGTCWTLSNGFQPSDRPNSSNGSNGSINGNSLSASDPPVLKEIRKEKAINGNKEATVPNVFGP